MTSLVTGNNHNLANTHILTAPDEILLHILTLTPDSTLFVRSASRALKQAVDDFLEWNKREIFRVASNPDVHPLLFRCLHSHYIGGNSDLLFHVSVRREIRALGISLMDSPGTLLSPGEILQGNDQIQDIQNRDLRGVWGSIHPQMATLNPQPAGLPGVAAPAGEIRLWMRAETNQPMLQEITMLRLRRHVLTCVPRETALCTSLHTLNLSNNRLLSLPEELFRELTQLQELNLSHNQLISLPEDLFQGLAKLQTLYLSHNQLASLPEGLFQGLAQLQWIYLSHNRLTSLPEDLFRGLAQLQWIYLSHNWLTSLPKSLFRGLAPTHCPQFPTTRSSSFQ